jgi:spore coat polysaccharide biosynthesis protein SpsF (cytidylyltransferase family)/diadenosine tetraphosphate (Ap4A) HIT family hydrolase
MSPALIAVATTDQPGDDVLVGACEVAGVPVVRGDEHDVLDRYRLAIEELRIDLVIRVTADSPFVWHEDIDRVTAAIVQAGPDTDYATNSGCPAGLNVEAAWADRLREAAHRASDPYDREHVMPFLYRHPGRNVLRVEPAGSREPTAARLTLDTLTDYGFLTALWARADAHGVPASPEWLAEALESTEMASWHQRAKDAAITTAGAPASTQPAHCGVCSILESLESEAHQLSGGWVLNGNIDPRTARPALVLTSRTHRANVDELNDAEATWLGRNLRRIDPVLRAISGAERIQVLLINEAGHVHLHLVPRYAGDDPRQFGLGLLGVPAPSGALTPVAMAAAVVSKSL